MSADKYPCIFSRQMEAMVHKVKIMATCQLNFRPFVSCQLMDY